MNRSDLLDRLDQKWDVIVIGGGITGAGVFREACRRGYKTLLIEQRDFAWGTSSRSGKMVHGGIRYILQGQIATSYHSVRERERLLREYAGLVNPMTFAFTPPWKGLIVRLGSHIFLGLYDMMAGRRSRRYHSEDEMHELLPGFATHGQGGFSFLDGSTDDARLVLRVLSDGRQLGGVTVNYVAASDLLRDTTGHVRGVAATDAVTGETFEIEGRVVINATGAWADDLRTRLGHSRRLRRLRGSHLLLPKERLPIELAIGLQNPVDGRKMYALPWEGVTLVGTTDLDHETDLNVEPRIGPGEGSYLLDAINACFPEADLTREDVIATQAGVRPVVDTGKSNPSKESREEVVWADSGMVTISGGKLTTFPLMARKTLRAAKHWLAGAEGMERPSQPPQKPPSQQEQIQNSPVIQRLTGRYGSEHATSVLDLASDDRVEPIEDTHFLWPELIWAARHEQVVHLDDLMLRRTRLGILLPQGGAHLLSRVRETVQDDLGWDDDRWEKEAEAYQRLWNESYSPALLDE